uniref:Clusterin n=1 Tax=Bubo bubo TaxID=30461 RepID=A0A8C0FXS9_BUBBB
QDVCNETMLALWEECKPCLKQTCMRFYSRTCHSGSGLVGRQLEEFLNHSSPFSIWVNGERFDSLLERDQRQEQQLEDLEEGFGLLEDGVDDIFRDSTQVSGRMYPFFRAPFGGFREAFRPPVQHVRLPPRSGRVARELHPFFQHPHQSFHRLFQPLFEMMQIPWKKHFYVPSQHPGVLSRNSSNERMVCREIRRNSAGCLRMRDECEKCREILSDALRLAERFTRRYDTLLHAFQAEMLNTTSLLEQLNRQFGWVSRLANMTQGTDGFLQVTTVRPVTENKGRVEHPPPALCTEQINVTKKQPRVPGADCGVV